MAIEFKPDPTNVKPWGYVAERPVGFTITRNRFRITRSCRDGGADSKASPVASPLTGKSVRPHRMVDPRSASFNPEQWSLGAIILVCGPLAVVSAVLLVVWS